MLHYCQIMVEFAHSEKLDVVTVARVSLHYNHNQTMKAKMDDCRDEERERLKIGIGKATT